MQVQTTQTRAASRTNIDTVKTAVRLARAARNPYLLTRIIGGHEPGEGEEFVWDESLRQTAQASIMRAVRGLQTWRRGREFEVLLARFGDHYTLREVGRTMKVSRERVRQLEARGLHRVRSVLGDQVPILEEALSVGIVKDGPCDPAWVTIKEAQRITGYSADHLRYLASEGKVTSRRHPTKGNYVQIERDSLWNYVQGRSDRGARRRGQWNESS